MLLRVQAWRLLLVGGFFLGDVRVAKNSRPVASLGPRAHLKGTRHLPDQASAAVDILGSVLSVHVASAPKSGSPHKVTESGHELTFVPAPGKIEALFSDAPPSGATNLLPLGHLGRVTTVLNKDVSY